MIFFDQASLRHAVAEYIDHYHAERPHQGLSNAVPSLPIRQKLTHATDPPSIMKGPEDYCGRTTERKRPENRKNGLPMGESFSSANTIFTNYRTYSELLFPADLRMILFTLRAIRLQLECLNRDNDGVADLAIKAFELSQSLTERWITADYNAKRTILSIMLETVRLNSGNLEFCPRKPFDLLRDENFVPLSGGGGN